MELDDLRKNWLKPPPEPVVPLNSVQLNKLLVSRPGLVDKMHRNAIWETAFSALIVLMSPLLWFTTSFPLTKVYAVIGVLMGVGLLYYYYRLFAVLNRMRLVEGNVRGHLQELAAGLRALFKFYYRLTLATGPALMCMNFGYFVGRELARATPFRWKLLLIVGGMMLVLGGLLQVLAVYGTRWYMQRLYGQHLDRLEHSLQELNEPPAI